MKHLLLSTCAALALWGSATAAWARDPSGAYLAARQARYDYNFDAAARYFTEALLQASDNQAILEQAVVSLLSLGDFDRALPIAQRMDAGELPSQAGHMAIIADLAANENYTAMLERLTADKGVGPLADGLLKAWAEVGAGNMTRALDLFDEVSKEPGLRDFGLYHKGLALASVGDFEAAVEIFSGDLQRTRQGVIAWAQALSQLQRQDDARKVLEESFGPAPEPEVAVLQRALAGQEPVPFTVVRSAREGIAEVFYSLGQALLNGSGDDFVLLFARTAEHVNPAHIDATLMAAQILGELGQYGLATKTYQKIPRDNPSYLTAELGRANALNNEDKVDAATEVLEQLAAAYPDNATVAVARADLLRQHERFREAVTAYDAALALFETQGVAPWFVYYARGICHERLDDWPASEADFRKALELDPDQPQVLNYLGYSLVEEQTNLDEAQMLIERAVELEPNSGYIVDSLGWVLYRLGKYEEAVGQLERAAELMAVDPVVNDHLGDALWMVGRKTEAEFQWRRALSFIDPEKPAPDTDPERIRRKLEVGLDVVRAEEETKSKKVADEN